MSVAPIEAYSVASIALILAVPPPTSSLARVWLGPLTDVLFKGLRTASVGRVAWGVAGAVGAAVGVIIRRVGAGTTGASSSGRLSIKTPCSTKAANALSMLDGVIAQLRPAIRSRSWPMLWSQAKNWDLLSSIHFFAIVCASRYRPR